MPISARPSAWRRQRRQNGRGVGHQPQDALGKNEEACDLCVGDGSPIAATSFETGQWGVVPEELSPTQQPVDPGNHEQRR